MILGVFDRLGVTSVDDFAYVHALVEATKCAFRVRDKHVGDPDYMSTPATELLSAGHLDEMAATIDKSRAAPWPDAATSGDTVWLGAVDNQGRAVSFIQSVYWEFGSGIVLPQSGITWQNRGVSFSLDQNHHNCLKPLRRPFHTIQPALAQLSDGRVMPYGTLGRGGSAPNASHDLHSTCAERLLFATSHHRTQMVVGPHMGQRNHEPAHGKTGLIQPLIDQLRAAGHDVEVVGDFEEIMGHAGALVHHPDGLIEGASDPRSDGAAIGF